mmetsp:Transcript_53350/g.119751  ORF Transcript_53350/g.119751 Transcript_53350/m.119751 type:complete len:172 (-) Transcript_53350:914-1429(-)
MHPEISWYMPFARDPAADPLTVTTDAALLGPVHNRLMSFHAAAFASKGLNASAVPPMSKIALGVWTTDKFARLTSPVSANMHWMIKDDRCPAEACLRGVNAQQYNALVYRPNPARNIHLANNDYAWTGDQEVPCCWAEQSLKPAERALHRAWGLPRPGWLNATYWDLLIAD